MKPHCYCIFVDTSFAVSYYPLRGVETSLKDTDCNQPRKRWLFCACRLSTNPAIGLSTELCREGDEYNTLRGNKSAAFILRPFRTS